MRVKELIDYQHKSGNICLMRQGLFLRGYNQGAVLLNKLFGYRIKRGSSPACGDFHYVGFPSSASEKVIAGVVSSIEVCRVVNREDNYIEFTGISLSCQQDEAEKLAAEFTNVALRPKRRKVKDNSSDDTLEAAILSFDISRSTPLDALHLIANLQQKISCRT